MTASPTIVTSVRVSPEFHQLCRENGINLTEALRVGISLMLAEKGIGDYDNRLNLYRKMTLFREQLEKLSIEHNELKKKVNTDNQVKEILQ